MVPLPVFDPKILSKIKYLFSACEVLSASLFNNRSLEKSPEKKDFVNL